MLVRAAGLRLRSCWEVYGVELQDVQDRSLQGGSQRAQSTHK